MKSTPVDSAIARTASCTGLPTVTPQVAFASPMRHALWSASVVSSPARPGAFSFGPPLKPAKKCGSTNPVVMRTSASIHSRLSHTGTSITWPQNWRLLVVASVVVHDPHALEHVGAEHRLELGRGVAPMGAGGNEHHDVVGVHDALELVEHGRDHQMPRLRSGAVAHRDRNRLAGTHAFTERSAHRRAAQRGEQRSPLVGHCLRLGRRDNDRALARHVDLHAGLSVCEPHLHRGGAYDRVRHSVLSTVTS